MIYLDTSVALAHLLSEDRRPPDSLWRETLVSSRLLEYEIWVPLHSRGLYKSHGNIARWLIGQIALWELTSSVLARALDAFPVGLSLRTLDALHLATCTHLIDQHQSVELASYDQRMLDAARALAIPLYELSEPMFHRSAPPNN